MQGIELRRTREAQGVSQERLAEAMGVGRSYISQVENRVRVTERLRDRYLAALGAMKESAA
jgi:transcriptional regulator with XRE-family HTH domain